MNDQWSNATGVLKPETLKKLSAVLSSHGHNLVDGWAATNPEGVQEMEREGTLLERAKEAQDQATNAQQRAADAGVTHLSAAEINEVYGGPSPIMR